MSESDTSHWQLIPNSLRYSLGGMMTTGGADGLLFFSKLRCLFPEATTLYIEGRNHDEEVKAHFRQHVEPGPYLPKRGTSYPEEQVFRCRISDEFVKELVRLAEHRSDMELCAHLHVYHNEQPLLIWYDAFLEATMPADFPESRVAEIAEALEMKYYREEEWRAIHKAEDSGHPVMKKIAALDELFNHVPKELHDLIRKEPAHIILDLLAHIKERTLMEKQETEQNSPLDVSSVPTEATTDDILAVIAEARERSSLPTRKH